MTPLKTITSSAITLTFCVTPLLNSGCMQNSTNSPNIVLILMDDMGFGDIGINGAAQYETPNINRLANEGIQYNYFYSAQPVSSASRAGLLTGCYPNRVGITGALMPQSTIGLNPEETTIAELLDQNGYKSIAIGKWHVGHVEEFLPLQNGFDEFFGLPYSNDMWPVGYDGLPSENSFYPPLRIIEENTQQDTIKSLNDQDQLTTRYTERAVKFINENNDKPFFLYLAHSMPHVPLGVSEKFKGKSKQGKYGDVIMEIDWSVGEIMYALENNNITDNTLIIFVSDNGPWLNFGNHAGSAGALREGKNTSWEGGQRVPCIMKWPEVIPEGTICNKLASSIDILPTLAEITNSKLPERKIDGVSILSLMKNEPNANPRREILYYFRTNSLEAVQRDYWKLVLPHTGNTYTGMPGADGFPGRIGRLTIDSLELYDLRRDPCERYDVSDIYPDKVAELQTFADEARKDLGDDLTGVDGENRREPGRSL